MAETKKDEAVVVPKVEVKRKRDLTDKEIAKLPTIKVMLQKVTTKSNFVFYNIIAKFHDQLKVKESIEEEFFNLGIIKLNNKEPEDELVVTAPYRAFVGTNVSGYEYKRFELLISEHLYKSIFFNTIQLELAEELGLKINFLPDFKKDVKFDADEF